MEEIICLSSGSDDDDDDDSDLEVISTYKEEKEDAVPFIRSGWFPVTPVLINITGHNFTAPRQRCSKRDTCSSLEVIDLSDDDPADDVDLRSKDKKVNVTPASFGKPQESQSESSVGKDVTNSGLFVGNGVQSVVSKSLSQKSALTDVLQRTENHLHQDTNCNSILPSEHLSWDKSLEYFSSGDIIKKAFKCESEVVKDSIADESLNTKDTQISTLAVCSRNADQENSEDLDSSQKWEDSVHSAYSLDSPYYCPSEVEDYIFSDSSNKSEDEHQRTIQRSSDTHPASVPEALSLKEEIETMNIVENEAVRAQVHPECSSTSYPTSFVAWSPELKSRQSKPNSPTSTEILASDTAAHSPDPFMLSSPSFSFSLSPFNSRPSTPNLPETADAGSPESPPIRLCKKENAPDNVESDVFENNSQERQHISLAQYRKLSQYISGAFPLLPEEEEENELYGPPEPLCRQSLSLVYSTIEEKYPEGTLQLLSDFIQPRYYPPLDVTTHLLRGIFLDPQSTDVLVLEAYNLLMKIQRYHPVDASTVPWDWELLRSVMRDEDGTRRVRLEVRYMLLQYVLQVLEDDFNFKLKAQSLQQSVAQRMLSCGAQTFGQVKDVINWILNAAKESVTHSKEYPKKEDYHLKIVLSLQRMLTLALEVDKNPTCNSDKLSEELFRRVTELCSGRPMRLLLLTTLENKLLKYKLLKLILEEACSQKTCLPVSLSLLHYLKSSTLASDPADGAEKWRKWDELLQLLWMLMLCHEEVVTGYLCHPITKRFGLIHAPNRTPEDQVQCSAVQEASDAFLSRAADDIGHSVPMEMQDLLSQLQEHILDTFSVKSLNLSYNFF